MGLLNALPPKRKNGILHYLHSSSPTPFPQRNKMASWLHVALTKGDGVGFTEVVRKKSQHKPKVADMSKKDQLIQKDGASSRNEEPHPAQNVEFLPEKHEVNKQLEQHTHSPLPGQQVLGASRMRRYWPLNCHYQLNKKVWSILRQLLWCGLLERFAEEMENEEENGEVFGMSSWILKMSRHMKLFWKERGLLELTHCVPYRWCKIPQSHSN